MCSTSGHVIHLMPGDHKFCTPEIPIVVVWNGLNHYAPTYTSSTDSTLKWKMSIIAKHINEATSLFGEIEGDLDDSEDLELCEQFYILRDTAVQSKKLLAKSHISTLVIPPSHIGPDPRDIITSLTRSTTLQEHPIPAFKGQQSLTLESVVDIAKAANYLVPLVPSFPETQQTESEPPSSANAPTQTVQAHPKPISFRSSNILPPPPKTIESGEFNIPVGSFLETKRLWGGKPLKPSPHKDAPKLKLEITPELKSGIAPTTKSGIARGSETGNCTNPQVIVNIPLANLPPQAPVSSSAPVTSAPVTSAPVTSAPVTSAPVSSVQSALNLLSASLAHSALGKGVSGRGRGKGKGPLLLKCTFKSCTYSTFNKGDFRIYMEKHAGVRYRCGICPKDFGSNKAKETHIRTAHLGQHRANCPELGCNFSHNDHGVTRVHLYVEHGIGEEPKCKHPDCKGRDMFSNFRVYERHKKFFHIAKDEKCPHCVRKFKGPEKLQAHIQVSHKQKVTVQCDQCGRFFASSKSLTAHKESQH